MGVDDSSLGGNFLGNDPYRLSAVELEFGLGPAVQSEAAGRAGKT